MTRCEKCNRKAYVRDESAGNKPHPKGCPDESIMKALFTKAWFGEREPQKVGELAAD